MARRTGEGIALRVKPAISVQSRAISLTVRKAISAAFSAAISTAISAQSRVQPERSFEDLVRVDRLVQKGWEAMARRYAHRVRSARRLARVEDGRALLRRQEREEPVDDAVDVTRIRRRLWWALRRRVPLVFITVFSVTQIAATGSPRPCIDAQIGAWDGVTKPGDTLLVRRRQSVCRCPLPAEGQCRARRT
jgi:hypothetical protein